MLSARNQFQGTIKSVKLGNVMAEIVVTVGDLEIVSAITRTSAETRYAPATPGPSSSWRGC